MLLSFDCQHSFARRAEHKAFHGPFGNGYALHVAGHFRAIAGLSIPVDIVQRGADLSRYRLLVVPALYVLDDDLARTLEAFAEAGVRSW